VCILVIRLSCNSIYHVTRLNIFCQLLICRIVYCSWLCFTSGNFYRFGFVDFWLILKNFALKLFLILTGLTFPFTKQIRRVTLWLVVLIKLRLKICFVRSWSPNSSSWFVGINGCWFWQYCLIAFGWCKSGLVALVFDRVRWSASSTIMLLSYWLDVCCLRRARRLVVLYWHTFVKWLLRWLLYCPMSNLILQVLLFLEVSHWDFRHIFRTTVILLDTRLWSSNLKRLFFFQLYLLFWFLCLLFYPFVEKCKVVLVFWFSFCIIGCLVGVFPLF
jgi:hypothetical protein